MAEGHDAPIADAVLAMVANRLCAPRSKRPLSEWVASDVVMPPGAIGPLIARTSAELRALELRVGAGRLKDKAKIVAAAARILAGSGVARLSTPRSARDASSHYDEAALHYEEKLLAGRWVVTTSLTPEQASAAEVVVAYRRLLEVESTSGCSRTSSSCGGCSTGPRSGSGPTSACASWPPSSRPSWKQTCAPPAWPNPATPAWPSTAGAPPPAGLRRPLRRARRPGARRQPRSRQRTQAGLLPAALPQPGLRLRRAPPPRPSLHVRP